MKQVTRDPVTGKFRPADFPLTQAWKSWKDVKPEQWPWIHFTPEEIACRGTGKLIAHTIAMDMLETLRIDLGKPIILNSAYRSPEHNKTVGGEANSYHMAKRVNLQGDMVMAFDCSMANHEPAAFEAAAKRAGFAGIGHYPLTKDGRHNFMHIDNGPKRTWNSAAGRFPMKSEKPAEVPKRFDPEPAKPTIVETLLKPEIVAPAGTLIAGSGVGTAIQDPSNPVAWVIAAILLIGAIGAGIYIFSRIRGRSASTTRGQED